MPVPFPCFAREQKLLLRLRQALKSVRAGGHLQVTITPDWLIQIAVVYPPEQLEPQPDTPPENSIK